MERKMEWKIGGIEKRKEARWMLRARKVAPNKKNKKETKHK